MEKRIELNLQTRICFIGLEKAYDCVDRGKLFDIMLQRKIPKLIISVLRWLYENTTIRQQLGNGVSKYAVNQGVREGCPVSCVLFNIYMNNILREWYQK